MPFIPSMYTHKQGVMPRDTFHSREKKVIFARQTMGYFFTRLWTRCSPQHKLRWRHFPMTATAPPLRQESKWPDPAEHRVTIWHMAQMFYILHTQIWMFWVGGCVSFSKWMSEWVSERECESDNMSKQASEWVSEWVSEWLRRDSCPSHTNHNLENLFNYRE